MNIFKIESLDIKDKKGNLKKEASGKTTSTKYFPIFERNNQIEIFKPLSKTKPLSTPLFSYSEVYWSYLINKYIDKKTPVYSLAYCKGLEEEQAKYYCKGCLVPNILDKDEELINLLELFRKYQEETVDIDNYINYCELEYDYVPILNSNFFENHKDLRRKLCEQILCSILRRDENYHYENISFIMKNGKITEIAPIIDQEFSLMFMYPDMKTYHQLRFSYYDEGLEPLFQYNKNLQYEENKQAFQNRLETMTVYDKIDRHHFYNLRKNIWEITRLHEDVVREFLEKIEKMKQEITSLKIEFDDNFLETFSSRDWEATRMIYKEKKSESDLEYQAKCKEVEECRITLNPNTFNKTLQEETLFSIEKLESVLTLALNWNKQEKVDLENYENRTLYHKVERFPEEILTAFIEKTENTEKSKNLKKKK